MKDVPVPRSRTPTWPHGCGQAGTRIYPWARRPLAMRPDGHRRAGTRNHPFASRGHPWALMGTRKRREGCVAQGKGLRPSDRIDSGKRREGAPLRGSRQAVRPHRRPDQPEGSSDSRRRPPPLVRFDTLIGGRAVLDCPDARPTPSAGRRGPPGSVVPCQAKGVSVRGNGPGMRAQLLTGPWGRRPARRPP
jgi:hypothetical protein